MENRDPHELEETVHCLRKEVARQKENAAEYQRAHRRLAVELERVDAQLRAAHAQVVDAEARAQRSGDQLRTLGVEKMNLDLQLQQALDRAAPRLECRSGGQVAGVAVRRPWGRILPFDQS